MTRRRAVETRVRRDGVTRRRRVGMCCGDDQQWTILRAALDGFWLGDTRGRLLEVNDAYCRMSGYSERELLSMRVTDLEVLDSPARTRARGRRIAARGPERFETRHKRKDGTAFDVEVTLAHTAGNPGCFVAILRDITDRVEMRARNERFSQEIIAAREEERKRFSAALHHDVGSLAVGVSAQLEAADAELAGGRPGRARAELQRARKMFEQSVVRLKDLAVQLRPPELDVLGICAALRQHFAYTTNRGGARIRFTERLGRKRVSGAIATTLFRVAQEAVTNAIAHGRATQVDVDLRPSKGGLTLTVRDHGQGFDVSGRRERSPHLGLRVMAEMAAAVGGTFEISGGLGQGATVRVTLPLEPGGNGA